MSGQRCHCYSAWIRCNLKATFFKEDAVHDHENCLMHVRLTCFFETLYKMKAYNETEND